MEITKELYEVFDTLGHAVLDKWGAEINDPRPMFVPGHVKPLTITEQIQRLMRVELSRQAQVQGLETFEESDDFEDDDEDDAPPSVYQQMESEAPLMKPEKIEGKKVDDGIDEVQKTPEDPGHVDAGGGDASPPPPVSTPPPKGKRK